TLTACSSATTERRKNLFEGTRIDVLEARAALLAAAKTFKPLEFRLALGVDLAAVEFLALLLVADDLIGGIDLGKLRLCLLISRVLVGMVLLGELPVGALDLGLA